MLYANIILPVPINQTFTYIIPETMEGKVQVGMRVMAPFGKNHSYTGIIISITPHCPEGGFELRPILQLLDDSPIIRHPQYPFWQWVSDYYMCAIGDVMKAALPSELKPEEGKQGTVRENFRAKTRTMVRICISDELRSVFDQLRRTPQQQVLFMRLLDMSHYMQKKEPDAVPKDVLLKAAGTSTAIFNELQKKGLLTTYEEEVSRLDIGDDAYREQKCEEPYPLTEPQQEAYQQICRAFRHQQVCLLHGVTSSGKTEVYMHLIAEVLKQRSQALLMVPEIALTTQLCMRLRRVFGRQMLVYHSKLSDTERVEIWKKLLDDTEPRLIVGVRSSIFLPFAQLGLIIVDEEHEPSYKQQDPAPRYHGRDAAIMLAVRHHARVLLGSATPCMESLHLAQTGKYGLVTLTERHAGVSLPKMTLTPIVKPVDGDMSTLLFTPALRDKLTQTLRAGQQAILFQNRRGYSQSVECPSCAWTPRCPRCDVSLTYHKGSRSLECHYCGYRQPWPHVCPQCGCDNLDRIGSGTERIEETLTRVLPAARPVRMDTDTTTTRKSYERIIDDFEQHKANVLIGTQMVSKGLDFSAVSTVGILNADSLMNMPDFRAHERAFQLMEQVAGRAGRRSGQTGEVIIQCHDVRNELLRQVVHHDYMAMAATQLADRKEHGYPPFSRLIMIYMKGRYVDRLEHLMAQYASMLRACFGQRVLGPEEPPVGRVKNMYIRHILLKVEREASTAEVRRYLLLIQQQLAQNNDELQRVVFYYDVDPV